MKQMNKHLFKLIESDYYQLTPQLTDMPILKSYYKLNTNNVLWFGTLWIMSIIIMILSPSILGIFNFILLSSYLLISFYIHHRAVSLRRFKSNNIEFVIEYEDIFNKETIEEECDECDRPIEDCICEDNNGNLTKCTLNDNGNCICTEYSNKQCR